MERYIIPTIFGQDIGIIVEGKHGLQFQYSEAFEGHRFPISPLKLPYDPQRVYTYHDAMPFNGLPGIFNDSLPDRFGSMLMDAYLFGKYGHASRLSVIDKLLYVGSNGMGAIEYKPAMHDEKADGLLLRAYIDEVRAFMSGSSQDVIGSMTRHPSPGGARPKAAIVWNREDDLMRVGVPEDQVADNEAHWIVKFDEVGREDTLIEYVYMQIAKEVGIEVPECDIISMGNEHHFALKRFDRTSTGEKVHMATLAGLLHLDFNVHVSTGYETCMKAALALTQDHRSVKEIFRRMVFNVIGRNCDDHAKNISFLMDRSGAWRVSPGYDLLYNYGKATFGQHRMSVAGKIDRIDIDDIAQCGYENGLEPKFMKETVAQVSEAFASVQRRLLLHGVSATRAEEIAQNILRLDMHAFPLKIRKKHRGKISSQRKPMDRLSVSVLKKLTK